MSAFIQVTAAVIIHAGCVLIAQRGIQDRMAGLWEFPGGKIEAGETPEQCLKRELTEELALAAEIGEHLGTHRHRGDHLSIELMVYRAHWDGRPFRRITHQACRWVEPENLLGYSFTPADQRFVHRLANGRIPL